MRATVLLAALAAAGSASAVVTKIAAEDVGYEWDVTAWNAGCIHDGCFYDFKIAAVANLTATPEEPAFSFHCAGQGEGSPYRLCESLTDEENGEATVVAKLLPSTNSTVNGTRQATIKVSLKHTDLETPTTWWNYTGSANTTYNQFSAPALSFTMRPDEIFGVA